MDQQGYFRPYRDGAKWRLGRDDAAEKDRHLVLKKAGLIDYYCRFHPNMKATLEVAP